MKIIPVIHHIDLETTLKNFDICIKNNVFGVFLISMDGKNDDLSQTGLKLKSIDKNIKIGINLLGESALECVKESIDFGLDMAWSDEPIITSEKILSEAIEIKEILKNKNGHLFFNSVAFKYQKIERKPGVAASNSTCFNFIPTTSGEKTGVSADLVKILEIKNAINEYPLALASGLTPENVKEYVKYIEYGLVSTGISKNFHEFENIKLEKLMKEVI